MHHILNGDANGVTGDLIPAMSFYSVEANLRESFRVLAAGRPGGDVLELPGVSVASVGVAFQMFNAAFLNGPVQDAEALSERLETARAHFEARRLNWSFWFCADWLDKAAERKLDSQCARAGLRMASEMPGMIARGLMPPRRPAQPVEFRLVRDETTLTDFQTVGAKCFHVPPAWFQEVFDRSVTSPRHRFRCWVGYLDGVAAATGALVASPAATGLYNIATQPAFRGRGLAEAMTRRLAQDAREVARDTPLILQSSPMGLRLYKRLGFETVTRIVVYNST